MWGYISPTLLLMSSGSCKCAVSFKETIRTKKLTKISHT